MLEVGRRPADRPGRRARLPGVRPRRGRLPGPRPGLPRRRSPATTSSTPARRSSARRSPAGSPRRGSASTSAPAASSPSPSGPASTWPGSASTATTRALAELERAVDARRRPDHRRLLPRDRAARRGRRAARPHRRGCMVRVTAGVEAHTHEYIATAHEDQKFGFSITNGDALDAVRRVLAAPALELLGLHSPHRLADLRLLRLRGGRPPGARAARADLRASSGSSCPSSTSAAASASPTPPRTTRPTPAQLATEMTKIVAHECRALGDLAVPRLSIEPGPGDRRPGDVHRLRGRHGQGGRARRRRGAHLRLRRRRHERQHPHRAVRRRLLLHPRQPPAPTRRRCWPGSSASTARPATSWSRTSSCPATSPRATWSRCPAPAPTAARWPATTTTRSGRRSSRCATAQSRVVVRRETVDDLLATDVWDAEPE